MAQSEFIDHSCVNVDLPHSHRQVDLAVGRGVPKADDELVEPFPDENGFGLVGLPVGSSPEECPATG